MTQILLRTGGRDCPGNVRSEHARGALELANLGVGLAQLAGGDDILTGTAVVTPASANRFQLRITPGEISSSRLSSASVFSPVKIRWTVVRLNSVLTRVGLLPSAGVRPWG